jgi:hypothetical protein
LPTAVADPATLTKLAIWQAATDHHPDGAGAQGAPAVLGPSTARCHSSPRTTPVGDDPPCRERLKALPFEALGGAGALHGPGGGERADLRHDARHRDRALEFTVLDGYTHRGNECYLPYYFQAATQLGYPKPKLRYLRKVRRSPDLCLARSFVPRFTVQEGPLFVYGEDDP